MIAPFIFARAHGVTLNVFIRSETAGGKSMVDALFAIAMHHVHRFVPETKRDATTPEQLVRVLHDDGGIDNCMLELLCVH